MSKIAAVLVVIVILWISESHTARNRVKVISGNGYSVAMKAIQCTSNTSRVAIESCKIKVARGITGLLSFKFNVLQQEKAMNFRIYIERKNSANKFAPTIIDSTFDICAIAKNQLTLAPLLQITDMILPNSYDLLKTMLHACPYQGQHGIVNYSIPILTAPNFFPTGDIKVTGEFSDKMKQALLKASLLLYIKTPSLLPIN